MKTGTNMANHTATSWGAGTSSTKQGSLGEKTHFYGFRYIGQHNAKNR